MIGRRETWPCSRKPCPADCGKICRSSLICSGRLLWRGPIIPDTWRTRRLQSCRPFHRPIRAWTRANSVRRRYRLTAPLTNLGVMHGVAPVLVLFS